MKTTQPISTIHYCDIDVLKFKLDALVQRNVITFYAMVYHYAESDEQGKNHIHLYLEPNGQLQTDALRDELEVPTIDLTKPIRCLPFNKSKWTDWYMYSLHDTRYLLSKGQSRQYHYTIKDFVSSDSFYLNEKAHTIDLSKLNANYKIMEAIENGISFEELVKNGQVPIQQIAPYKMAYELMSGGIDLTYRNGREGHIPNRSEINAHIKATKDTIEQLNNEIETSTEDLPF